MQMRTDTTEDVTVSSAPVTDLRADAALDALRRRARRSYWKARWSVGWAVLPAVLAGMLVGAVMFLMTHRLIGDDPAGMISMLAYLGIGFGGGSFSIRSLGRREAAELQRLAEHADLRAIRPLTDMVRGNVWAGSWFLLPVLRAVVAELTRILERATPNDRNIVGSDDLAGLRSILASCANHYGVLQARIFPPDFIRTALQALAILQDRHGASHAERLAHNVGFTRKADEVRRIAQDALPALREAAERARERTELLRPVENPNRPEDTLLRPAEAGPTGDVELLVRPAQDHSQD